MLVLNEVNKKHLFAVVESPGAHVSLQPSPVSRLDLCLVVQKLDELKPPLHPRRLRRLLRLIQRSCPQ